MERPGKTAAQVDNSPVLCVQASSSSRKNSVHRMPLAPPHRLVTASPCLPRHLRWSPYLSVNPFIFWKHHFSFISVDKECLKQSSETISTADNQCYLPATGFEISFIPEGGHYFHRLPWWCDAAVSLPRFCCFPMQSHHTLKLNHLSHLSQAFWKTNTWLQNLDKCSSHAMTNGDSWEVPACPHPGWQQDFKQGEGASKNALVFFLW